MIPVIQERTYRNTAELEAHILAEARQKLAILAHLPPPASDEGQWLRVHRAAVLSHLLAQGNVLAIAEELLAPSPAPPMPSWS